MNLRHVKRSYEYLDINERTRDSSIRVTLNADALRPTLDATKCEYIPQRAALSVTADRNSRRGTKSGKQHSVVGGMWIIQTVHCCRLLTYDVRDDHSTHVRLTVEL